MNNKNIIRLREDFRRFLENGKSFSIKNAEILSVFVLLCFALFLFLYNNTKENFWYKELLPIHYAGYDAFSIIKECAEKNPEAAPPLYYLLIKPVISIFGASLFYLRAFNAFLTCVLLLVVYLFTRYLFQHRTAFIASCLLLLNPVTIANAREVNVLPLATVLCVSALFSFYLAIQTGKIRYWIYYGLLLTLGLYTHYFFWFVFIGCCVYYVGFLLWWKPTSSKTCLIPFLIANIGACLLFFPWLKPFLMQWQALKYQTWFEPVNFLIFRNILVYFFTSKFAQEINPLIPGFIPALFIFFTIFFMLYPKLRHKIQTDAYSFLLIPVFLPLLITIAFSVCFFSIVNLRNYFLFFPFFIILAARAFTLIKHKFFKIFIPLLLCLSLLPTIYLSYSISFNGPSVELAAYLKQERKSAEPIVACDKISYITLDHYLGGDPLLYYFSISENNADFGHGIQTQEWYQTAKGLSSFWVVLVPWEDTNYLRILTFDTFVSDPQLPERVLSDGQSWLKFKLIHLIRS
jgi:4-amino-4-deoxy-L-arabinose transferase-like glycosyltransferase